MKCIHCNCELPDDSRFCANCGKPLPVLNPVPPVVPAPTEVPIVSAAPVVPAAPAPAEPVPVEPIPAEVPQINEQVPAQPPRKSKKWLLWTGIGVGVIAIILVILLLTGVFGGKNYPQDGAENLIKNGNFTVEVKAMGEKMTIQVDIDWDKEEVTIYAEDDGDFAFAIYDGYYISYDSWHGDYVAEDYSEPIALFFDNYEPGEEIDWEDVAGLVYLTTRVDPEDYVNLKQLGKCLDTLSDKLQNKKWLEKNAGYSKEKEDGVTLHVYEPDLYDLAVAVLQIFKPCMEDDYIYDYAMDMLDEYEDTLSALKIKLTLGVQGKYLVSAEAKVSGVKVKASFEDIGSTRIDMDALEDILDDAIYH